MREPLPTSLPAAGGKAFGPMSRLSPFDLSESSAGEIRQEKEDSVIVIVE